MKEKTKVRTRKACSKRNNKRNYTNSINNNNSNNVNIGRSNCKYSNRREFI